MTSIHTDRVRLAAFMDRLRVPPAGADSDVEAEVIEALELWGASWSGTNAARI